MQGGVGAFTQEIGQALAQLGHQIHIITSNKARPPQTTPSPSLKKAWQRIGNLSEPIPLPFGQLHPRARRWRWGDAALIADIALRYDLDLINIQYQPAAYNMHSAAIQLLPWRLQGLTKSIITCHDLRIPYLFPKAGNLRQRAVNFMLTHTDGIITTNTPDTNQLPTLAPKTPHIQIPIGSNIQAYTPHRIEIDDVRETLNLAPNDLLLAYFGFINESKGADTLIKALADMDKRTHLVFIGGKTGSSDTSNNASFASNLERLIRAFGLQKRVHWTGFLSDVRVSAHLHAADLIIMPYRDGASLRRGTLMAALAHGRPLITTTPNHPIPELHHGQNVWLIPPNNPKALAQAIKQLAQDPNLRHTLGQQAHTLAHQFSWERIATDTANFFSTISGK